MAAVSTTSSFRVTQPGGAIRWIHERGVLIVNERGKPYRASGISTDITERRSQKRNGGDTRPFSQEAERLSLTAASAGAS